MTEEPKAELAGTQAALQLILQRVTPAELGDMLWHLGYSVPMIGYRASADEKVRRMLHGWGMPRDQIEQEAVDKVHHEVVTEFRASIGRITHKVTQRTAKELVAVWKAQKATT